MRFCGRRRRWAQRQADRRQILQRRRIARAAGQKPRIAAFARIFTTYRMLTVANRQQKLIRPLYFALGRTQP